MLEMSPVHPEPLVAPCACERCERSRVREHLLRAIRAVQARPGGTPQERAARAALVGELVRYAIAGRFPRNEDPLAGPVPIFVDRSGTRCAVAHLLDHTGESELVLDVAARANGAFVPELARDARLASWLGKWHLTEAEAALIQPSYDCPDFDPAKECVCGMLGLDRTFVATFAVDQETGGDVLVVDAAYGSATVTPGEILRDWTMPEHSWSSMRTILARQRVEAIPHVIFETDLEGGTVFIGGCDACMPITQAPESAPLQAFIDVAEGADCLETFGALPGWGPQEGSESTSSFGVGPSGAGPSGAGPSGAGGGGAEGGAGGGAIRGVGGHEEPATTASSDSDDGCAIGATDPTTQALLWALTAGLALRRHRRARRPPAA